MNENGKWRRRVKQLRDITGLSHTGLAQRIGTDHTTLIKIENEGQVPCTKTREKIIAYENELFEVPQIIEYDIRDLRIIEQMLISIYETTKDKHVSRYALTALDLLRRQLKCH